MSDTNQIPTQPPVQNEPQFAEQSSHQSAMKPPITVPKSTNILLIFVAVSFGLLVVLLLGIIGVGVFYFSSSPKVESTLNVEATSTKTILPDTAVASFVYSKTGTDVQTLNTEADKKIETINAYLNKAGIQNDDIVTNKTSYPNYAYRPDGSYDQSENVVEVNYRVTFNDIQSNPSQTNTTLKALVDLGINRFYGFEYTVKNTENICKELDIETTKKAFDDAKSKIEALGGGKIISREVLPGFGSCSQNTPFQPYSMSMAVDGSKMDDTQTAPPELSTGSQELSSTVQLKVVYR